jgi:tetraacyldisaccharide 4'-kinase
LSESWEQFGRRVMSGAARGVGPALLRGGLSIVSPIYATLMRARNKRFDWGVGVKRLPRPVVSVGNVTTGGTGKTPVVRWLCERLREAGERPAVLMRGYKAEPGERGDEQAMLEGLLNREGVTPAIVRAEPNRYAGGQGVIGEHPDVGVLVMDDGFQHRRLARDFDLVLIDACEPFGYGRVIPRGLLREPLSGLRRADAILVTRANQVEPGALEAIVARVRDIHPSAPVYRCSHAHVGLRSADGGLHAIDELAGRRFYAFAGIGNPEGLEKQLQQLPGELVGHEWFPDHWGYAARDIERVRAAAETAGAGLIVTTEKDWVKVADLIDAARGIPVWRLELAVRFEEGDEQRLFEQIRTRVQARRS